MPTRSDQDLEALGHLRGRPVTPDAIARLRSALAGKHPAVVARAAKLAGELDAADLEPDLARACERLVGSPAKADPGCHAKTAIAGALDRLGHPGGRAFLAGVHFVQREPVTGGTRDTAGDFRAACAVGLAQMHHPAAVDEIVDLLADADAGVRVIGARAIACTESERGAPLLRMKILAGDAEPQVVSECLAALLKVAPRASLPFFERLLAEGEGPRCEAAAIALGESRAEAAFKLLRAWWQRTTRPPVRRTALLAIAMQRREPAFAFLLSLVAEGNGPDARDALAALAVHRDDDALRRRVLAAAEREDLDLTSALADFVPRHP